MKAFIAFWLIGSMLWAQNPNTAAFPSAVATDTTLPVANNLIRRTLNGNISMGATTFTVNTGSGTILAPVVLQIDSEIFQCNSISTNTLSSCTGHQEGTTSVAHSSGAPVVGYFTGSQQNQAYAEIKAIEKSLADRKLNAPAGDGTAQAQTVTLAPPLTAWAVGVQFCWIAAASNTGAAPTINPNGLGTKSITKLGTTALVAGDIISGDAACVVYDGTEAILQNPKTGAAGAYSAGAGISISGSVIGIDPAVTATKTGIQLNPEHVVTLTSSSGNTLTGTMSPTLVAYGDLEWIAFKWNQNCAGGAMTIAVDGLAATSLVKADGTTNLGTSDCLNGQTNIFSYDGSLSKFKLMAGGAVASGSVTGSGTSGRLTGFTGPSAVGNVDLTGDCPTSSGLATACASAYAALMDGSTVTWAIGSAAWSNKTLTFTAHGGSRTLNITGPVNGGFYTLKVKQDSTGGEGLTLGTGCTWLVSNGGTGAVTPSTGANAVDFLSFTYDGTNCYANFNKNFN